MKRTRYVWIVEKGTDTSPYWERVYASDNEDWAEQDFHFRISDLPKEEYRLMKREILCHYKPS